MCGSVVAPLMVFLKWVAGIHGDGVRICGGFGLVWFDGLMVFFFSMFWFEGPVSGSGIFESGNVLFGGVF